MSDGEGDKTPSFFQEYKYKLEKLYSNFYTAKGTEIAKQRQQSAIDFYDALYREVNEAYEIGKTELDKVIE